MITLKLRFKTPKKGQYVRFKNYENKKKSQFMIYADFESILVPETNLTQNPNKSFMQNIKNMLLAVLVTDQFVLMIHFSKDFK